MAENSKIEWTDHTFNPWTGCQKVSPACDNCYAEGWAKRSGVVKWGPGEDRRRTSASYWQQPLKWNRIAERDGVRQKVFCASLADVFDNAVPARWRDDLWHRIAQTPHLDWLLLTKRPQNIMKMLPDPRTGTPEWGGGWPNVWLGTTVENQEEANRRIPHLLAVPAAKRFLSCEPLLGPVDLTQVEVTGGDGVLDALNPISDVHLWREQWDPSVTGTTLEDAIAGFLDWGGTYPPSDKPHPTVDWVIVGGESGPHARPMHPSWARSLRDQCQAAGVPFFLKQRGDWSWCEGDEKLDPEIPLDWRSHPERYRCLRSDGGTTSGYDGSSAEFVARVGKKRAGALLDGREWREMPA